MPRIRRYLLRHLQLEQIRDQRRRGSSLCRGRPSIRSVPGGGIGPPAHFNSATYEYAQRQDTRYLAGLLLHLTVNESVHPYLEFNFMNDRTLTAIAPSGLFLSANTISSNGTYFVNCSNPLLSAQEAATICTPSQIAADRANPGSVSADLDIGRRNIEGGGRESTTSTSIIARLAVRAESWARRGHTTRIFFTTTRACSNRT